MERPASRTLSVAWSAALGPSFVSMIATEPVSRRTWSLACFFGSYAFHFLFADLPMALSRLG